MPAVHGTDTTPVTVTLDLAPEHATLHSIFTTAIEGGINYWCRVNSYRWALDNTDYEPDYLGFHAEITETESGEEPPPRHRIDPAVVRRGLVGFATLCPRTQPGYAELRIKAIRLLMGGEVADAVDYDASDADAFVQMGLFEEVVYG